MNRLSDRKIYTRTTGPNPVAKQQIVAKPVEHVTTAYACVMVKIGIFIPFIDWQVQLDKRKDKRDLLQRPLFPDTIYFQILVLLYKLVNASAVALVLLKGYKRFFKDILC